MKNIIKSLIAVAVIGSSSIASAVTIDGTIAFAGNARLYDGVPANSTLDIGLADGVSEWVFADVLGQGLVVSADGDFTGLALTTAQMSAPWAFNSGPIANFWQAGAFSFDLTSSSITSQNASGVIVAGNGTIKAAGFEDTAGTWFFSTQGTGANSNGRFSFSANSAPPVSDSGASIALLGLGLLATGIVARKRSK